MLRGALLLYAALRVCGALPRAPACWERSANRVLTPGHAEAFGTPAFGLGRGAAGAHGPAGDDRVSLTNRVTQFLSGTDRSRPRPRPKRRSAEGLGVAGCP